MAVYKHTSRANMRVKQYITKEEARRSLYSPITLSPDLKDIQPHLSQVLNYDEIGIDPNGTW